MPTVERPAGQVSYREAGPADGRAVVFVHGFLVDDTLWADVPDRLAARGLRCLAPTWPLGAHRTAMRRGADLSPRGLARVVASFLDALDLRDVVLVGNDTGGAICQLLLDEDPSRVARLVLTNCDAFESFPPAPFDTLFRLARSPVAGRVLLQPLRLGWLRTGRLGFGSLTERPLTAAETRPWVTPYLADAGVRRDVAAFARAWTGRELVGSVDWLGRFERPVLIAWGDRDRVFGQALARRLVATLPDAELVEIVEAGAFVSLDQPVALASAIADFVA